MSTCKPLASSCANPLSVQRRGEESERRVFQTLSSRGVDAFEQGSTTGDLPAPPLPRAMGPLSLENYRVALDPKDPQKAKGALKADLKKQPAPPTLTLEPQFYNYSEVRDLNIPFSLAWSYATQAPEIGKGKPNPILNGVVPASAIKTPQVLVLAGPREDSMAIVRGFFTKNFPNQTQLFDEATRGIEQADAFTIPLVVSGGSGKPELVGIFIILDTDKLLRGASQRDPTATILAATVHEVAGHIPQLIESPVMRDRVHAEIRAFEASVYLLKGLIEMMPFDTPETLMDNLRAALATEKQGLETWKAQATVKPAGTSKK